MSVDMLPRAVSSEFHDPSEFVAPIWGGGGAVVSIEELRKRFVAHEMSDAFAAQTPRYVKRHPIPEERAVEYIGNDACPLMHQFELADRHLMDFLDKEYASGSLFYPPSPEDRSLLYFLCSFHDFGEPEHLSVIEAGLNPVGDLPAGTKTPQNRRDETRILKFMLGTHCGDVDPHFIERAIAIITHNPLPGDELLHDIYQATHELQTLETATIAETTAERIDIPKPHTEILKGLGRSATASARENLESEQYFTSVRLVFSEEKSPVLRHRHFVTARNAHLHEACCAA